MVFFFIIPLALTIVWSVFERTRFWMEPGFTLFAYETFFTSARAENYLFSMIHSVWAVAIAFVIGFTHSYGFIHSIKFDFSVGKIKIAHIEKSKQYRRIS